MSAAATTSSSPALPAPPAIARHRLVRWAFAFLGVLLLGIAIVGVVIPGLPTTGPLIASMFFITRSCPWLQQRILNWRILRPYAVYLSADQPIPPRARVAALLMMWLAVLTSAMLFVSRQSHVAIPLAIILSGVLATIVIVRWRRAPRPAAQPAR